MKSAILFLLVPTFILQCLLGSGVLYWHEKQNANLGETITVFLVLQVLFMGTCSAIYYHLIQQPINILSQAIDHTISSQDLTQPIQEVRLSVLNGLLKKYAMLTKSFDDALIKVGASAARLSPMAQELGDTNMGIHQRNIVQQNHNHNIANTLKDIESSSQEMNQAVEKITEVASSSKETLDHSIASVEDSVQSINRLAQETAAAESISNQLYDSSSQIGDIINMINSIAEQTNLLALNAAIEAARAGEAGRGFAVVADEVRNLSIKTQESTFQIDEMIKKIQTDANDMMTTMKTSKQGSEESVAKVNDVKEHFDHIQNQFEEISSATTMISQAVGNNKTLIMEVIDENTQMNEVNEEIVNFTKTSAISDRDLVNLSRHIEGHLQGFLLSQKEFDTSLRTKKTTPSPDANEGEFSSDDDDDAILF